MKFLKALLLSTLGIMVFCETSFASDVSEEIGIENVSHVPFDFKNFMKSFDLSDIKIVRPTILCAPSFITSVDGKEVIDDSKYSQYFKPIEFWRQDVNKQILYIKDDIESFEIENEISKHCFPSKIMTFVTTEDEWKCLKDYPVWLEEKLEDAVYLKITKFIKENNLPELSKEEFQASLIAGCGCSSEQFAKFPLLFHFGDYLGHRYFEHPGDSNFLLRYPSVFREWLAKTTGKQNEMKTKILAEIAKFSPPHNVNV